MKVAMATRSHSGVSIVATATVAVLLCTSLFATPVQAQGMMGREFVVAPPFCSSERHLVVMLHPLRPCPSCHVTVTRSGFPAPHSIAREGPRTWVTFACRANDHRPLTLTSAFVLKSDNPTLAYLCLHRDTTILTPVTSLGRRFNPLTFHSEDYDYTFVSIAVAAENTTVELKSGNNMGGNSARIHAPTGDSTLRENFKLVLRRGDVITVTCHCDLSGLSVQGSKSLSVLSGSYSSGGNMNVIVENTITTSSWGNLHVLPRSVWMKSSLQLLLAGDGYKTMVNVCTQSENRTLFLPVSAVLSTTLEMSAHVSITSSHPIGVMALIAIEDGSHSMVALTPVEQYRPFELCPRQMHLSSEYVALAAMWKDVSKKKNVNNSLEVNSVTSALIDSALSQEQNNIVTEAPRNGLTGSFFMDVMSTDSLRVSLYNESITQEAETMLASNRARFSFLYFSPAFPNGQATIFTSGSFLAELYHDCVPANTTTTADDGIDNDCDGFIDEEAPGENADKGDEAVEDVGTGQKVCQEGGGDDWVVPVFMVGLTASGLAVLLSVGVALIATMSFILGNWVVDFARGGNRFRPPARVEPLEE